MNRLVTAVKLHIKPLGKIANHKGMHWRLTDPALSFVGHLIPNPRTKFIYLPYDR